MLHCISLHQQTRVWQEVPRSYRSAGKRDILHVMMILDMSTYLLYWSKEYTGAVCLPNWKVIRGQYAGTGGLSVGWILET